MDNCNVDDLIAKYGKDDQRTAEWHQKRGEMLTASEIFKACLDATPAMKHEIVVSKLVPRSSEGAGSRSLVWGTRFEQIAKDILFSKYWNYYCRYNVYSSSRLFISRCVSRWCSSSHRLCTSST
jgi:hypothetical protein